MPNQTPEQKAREIIDARLHDAGLVVLSKDERAMTELKLGPHRSGAIAAATKRAIQSVALVRRNLIDKGMIWSPGHGNTAFTVPMFDEFMRRAMPGDGWGVKKVFVDIDE